MIGRLKDSTCADDGVTMDRIRTEDGLELWKGMNAAGQFRLLTTSLLGTF
jgi:hypothetical protein